MEEPNSPYVWRGEAETNGETSAESDHWETVIVDGQVMSYRRYQLGTDPDLSEY